MSLIKKLLGKSAPAVPTPTERARAAPAEAVSRPDPAVKTREEEASLSQAIAAGDHAAVGGWVVNGSSTKVRQMAAQAITDPEQLRELIRTTRGGKDKTVYRILTDKRDAMLAEERRAQQQQADIDAATAAIARQAARPYDKAYEATLAQVEARWNALAEQATADAQQQVAADLMRAHECIERHHQELAAEAERQRAAVQAAEEARRERERQMEADAAAAAERASLLAAERQAELAKHEAEHAAARELVGLLRQAQAALDHGGTARAERLRKAIAEKLPEAPPGLPPWFARTLEQVDSRIDAMKDWKTFTVIPKRAELLQQMKGLVGAEISPEELARRIRHLRDDWRTLHRGAGDEPTPELEQFEEAAKAAYEPCREHFAKQAATRKENQAQREAIIVRLTEFAATQASEQVNLRAIQQALVESRREWQLYAPVDQSVVKDLQARFHAIAKDLQGRLSAEYARNVAAKRELIGRAAALLTLPDTRQAIEESKELQRTWKTLGPVPREQGDALWEEFRRHCDAVFARSSQEHAAYGAGLEANAVQATGLCEEAERITVLTGEELLSASRGLDDLRTQFESLELPRAAARDLRQRFRTAMDRCQGAVRRQKGAAARQAWADLFAAAGTLGEYALATVQGRSQEERDSLRAAAASAINALAQPPKGTRALLEQTLAKVETGAVSTDIAANETALRWLCIRAELAAGVETPPEDQELRREYQMQRLVAAMGRGERATPADLDSLALEWLVAGPVEATVRSALLARFERCRTVFED